MILRHSSNLLRSSESGPGLLLLNQKEPRVMLKALSLALLILRMAFVTLEREKTGVFDTIPARDPQVVLRKTTFKVLCCLYTSVFLRYHLSGSEPE